jgi:VanZ family protein
VKDQKATCLPPKQVLFLSRGGRRSFNDPRHQLLDSRAAPQPIMVPVIPRKTLWPLLVAATIFLASSRSSVAAPGISNIDKIAHFSVYGLLATLLVRLGHGPRAVAFALLAASLYGASDELHQAFVPGRSSEVGDWIADTAGAALAITLYAGWPWYRARLEAPLWKKRRIENPAVVATV